MQFSRLRVKNLLVTVIQKDPYSLESYKTNLSTNFGSTPFFIIYEV